MTKRVEYVIFDLDGLLIDSERVYTDVTNKILSRFGVEMTWDIKAGLMGKSSRDASVYLLSHFPDIPITVDEYLEEREAIQYTIWPDVPVLPGALRLVTHLKKHQVPLAIATGSHKKALELKLSKKKELLDCFDGRIVCNDDVLADGLRGKPFPDIFLKAARDVLGRKVGSEEECTDEEEKIERSKGLVFEDAIPGWQAGKRAGMSVVWVPDPNLLGVESGHAGAFSPDETLSSLEAFVPETWGLPAYDDQDQDSNLRN